MDNYVRFDQIVGKTVAAIHSPGLADEWGIRFTDGTFTYISVRYAGESTWLEGEPEWDGNRFLLDLGVITQQEFDRREDERKERGRRLQEERDRQQYEKLKAKFEV